MIAEVEVLLHVDDVVQVVLVFPLDDVQNLQLDQSLVMEPGRLQQRGGRLAIYFPDSLFFLLISRHRILFLHSREKINSRDFVFYSL